jgi:hypothetical protein
VPFLAHQVLEYLFGVLLLTSSQGLGRLGPVSVGCGVAVLLLAAFSDGPAGVRRLVPRRAHMVGDGLVVAALATGPLIVHAHLGFAIVIVEGMALLWLAMTVKTNYRKPVPRPAPTTPSPPTAPPGFDPRLGVLARRAGRMAGEAGRRGPRELGRAVGKRRPKP